MEKQTKNSKSGKKAQSSQSSKLNKREKKGEEKMGKPKAVVEEEEEVEYLQSQGSESEAEGESDMSEEEIAFSQILKKRQKTQEKEEKDSDEESKHSGSSYDELKADFELVAPCESFFHSIKMLLNQLCDDQKYDISGLADALIEQQSLGSLPVTTLGFDLDKKYASLNDEEFEKMRVKHNNERDVYGITTVIDFSNREEKPFLEDIYGYIMMRAKKHLDKAELKKFISILSHKNKVALFINERYLNLPTTLIPSLLKSIPEDIEFTQKQDDVADPSVYDFDFFLGMAKVSQDGLFYKAEEEKFLNQASVKFEFMCKNQDGGDQYKRVIYLLKYAKYKRLMENIEKVFKEEKN